MSLAAPVITSAIPDFHFPDHSVQSLTQGMKLLVVPDSSQELLTISVIAKFGATQEDIAGQALVTSMMLTQGTTQRSANQIADEVDALGATIGASAMWDTVSISLTGLRTNAEIMLDILSDCVLNPAFSEEEFARVQKRAMGDLMFELADPTFLCSRTFVQTIFAGHPYAHQRIGTAESLQQLNIDHCKRFYERMRSEAQWFCIVAGNTDDAFIQTSVLNRLGSLKSALPAQRIEPQPILAFRTAYTHSDSAQQTVLMIGQLLPVLSHPHTPALQLINTVFGGYFLSRTNTILREEKGFTYGAFSSMDSRYHAADLSVLTSISDENVAETIELLRTEWQKIATQPIPQAELDRARRYLLGAFVRSMETPQHVAQFVRAVEEFGMDTSYYENFVRVIGNISSEELFAIQQQHIQPETLVIAAYGNAEILRPVLERYAPPQNLVFH